MQQKQTTFSPRKIDIRSDTATVLLALTSPSTMKPRRRMLMSWGRAKGVSYPKAVTELRTFPIQCLEGKLYVSALRSLG